MNAVAELSSGGVTSAGSGQYLVLKLGKEEYAIDILRVQEIRSYEEPTRIVNAPTFVRGVNNLRGVIVSIVDLRLKLNFEKAEFNAFTVVIVLHLKNTIVGAVVDSVSDVVTLTADAIKPLPNFESSIDSRFASGIASVGERMIIVMNLNTLMSNGELGLAPSA